MLSMCVIVFVIFFVGLLSFGFRVILCFLGPFVYFPLIGVCVLLFQLFQGFDDAFLGDISMGGLFSAP